MIPKIPRSVLVLVHTRDCVLLLERVQPAGFWQSVTGSLEPGENWEEAAFRELQEETGFPARHLVDTGIRNLFPIVPPWSERYAPEDRMNEEHVFTLLLDRPETPCLQPREHLSSAWMLPGEAARRCGSRTNRNAILHQFPQALDDPARAS